MEENYGQRKYEKEEEKKAGKYIEKENKRRKQLKTWKKSR